MLAFITTSRHPTNATDYARVERQLEDTLASVLAQTSDDFIVIVVGNVSPPDHPSPRVRFVGVDFPPPPAVVGPHAERDAFVRDKGTKVGVGLVVAREYDPTHIMLVDADDFVHRELAAWVNARPHEAGWVINDGWMYSAQSGESMPINRFNRTCGTSMIVRYAAYNVPESLTLDATQTEVAAAFGETLESVMGAHREAQAWFARHGTALVPLPFRGAVYHVDTGENHSGKSLRDHLEKIGAAEADYRPRPLSVVAAREYGLPRHSQRALKWWMRNGVRFMVTSLRERVQKIVVRN